MNILHQFKYWWSPEEVPQHSHFTLTTHAFYPHHAAFEAVQWQDQRSDTATSWGMAGEWVKPVFSLTRSPGLSLGWEHTRTGTNMMARMQTDLNCDKQILNYTLGHSHYYYEVSTLSFMLIRSVTKSNSLIQQWVVINRVTELTWLSTGPSAQRWHRRNDGNVIVGAGRREQDHSIQQQQPSRLPQLQHKTTAHRSSLIISLSLSACCLPKEIAGPSFCPALSLVATDHCTHAAELTF